MPRIHAGNNQHRGSSHSRRATKQRSHGETIAINIGDTLDIDNEFDDFSYDEMVLSEDSSDCYDKQMKQQQRRGTIKQQKFTLEDTSSSEEEGIPSKSSRSKSAAAKKLSSKKKSSNKVSTDSSKRLTPTVTSPKITLSSIAKNESVKSQVQNKRREKPSSKKNSSKKGPIGKPIKSVKIGKKIEKDENCDNDADQEVGEQRGRRSRRKKSSAVKDNNDSSTKKKKNSLTKSDAEKNNQDVIGSRVSFMDDADTYEGANTSFDHSSIHEARSNSTTVLPLRAIAIDNRILPTFAADSTSRKSFFDLMPDFLDGLVEKGVLRPQLSLRDIGEGASIIASLVSGTISSSINGKQIGVRVEPSVVPHASFLQAKSSGGRLPTNEGSDWLSEFMTPINANLESVTEYGGDVALGFGAADSWRYFGDLVEAIQEKLSEKNTNNTECSQPKHPCNVTIFTTDTTFVAEPDSTSHAKGLDNFWKRLSPSFQSGVIAEVSIVIVGTKCDQINQDSEQFSNNAFRRSIECIDNVRRRISELSQSMQTSSEWVFDEWNGKPLINLNLQYIEGTRISFQSLSQKYVCDSFHETYSNVVGRLSFDLPETMDGIMCSISLDLQYSILPHPIGSNETQSLVDDIKRISALTTSNIEVVQSIPLSNVDSSMIYGVPMSARAGMDDDEFRYNEMKMLVRQMWKYLSNHEIGLVLRVNHDGNDDFGLSSGEELFLLVCEQAVEKACLPNNDSSYDRSDAARVIIDTKINSSCHGMLFRYATKGQMLRFANEDEMEGNEISAEELQYQDYIERSIEMLSSTGLNPLLL